jgi:hypothetical protein
MPDESSQPDPTPQPTLADLAAQISAIANGLAAAVARVDGIAATIESENGLSAALSGVSGSLSALTARVAETESSVAGIAAAMSLTSVNNQGVGYAERIAAIESYLAVLSPGFRPGQAYKPTIYPADQALDA